MLRLSQLGCTIKLGIGLTFSQVLFLTTFNMVRLPKWEVQNLKKKILKKVKTK